MFISESLGTDKNGYLTIGNFSAAELVKQFGTPLYVFDGDLIRKNMRSYVCAISDYYDGNGRAQYASKAFCCKEMAKIAKSEGLGLDVVSGGELYTALSAGFPADKIMLHGNNKSNAEICEAVSAGVGRIVADSISDVHRIADAARTKGVKQKILLRIKPGVEAHTHDFIKTGQNDSKFGISLETGEAFEAVRETLSIHEVELYGIHSHIGSQIFEEKPFVYAAELLAEFISKVKHELNYTLNELNLGGGFGIRYVDGDNPKPYYEYMRDLLSGLSAALEKHKLERPFIYVEPGRSIVGEAGVTLYTVGEIKEVKGVRKYVSVDGGMADNPRYILYGAEYSALLCDKPLAPPEETVTVSGKCCESGDILIENIKLPKLKTGDILAVLSTGAYNYSMASNYNRLPRPAAVMVNGEQAKIIIKRESYEDLIRNDI